MSKLFLVPTPIGNLKDITLRSLEVLKEVNVILAEDTRTSGKLLKHYEIDTQMWRYHMHNEHQIIDKLVDQIESGISMALITDAGTPGISDPGFLLLRACIDRDIPIDCLPGATAFVPGLLQSGFPNHNFVFEGFLPVKKGRMTKLESLKTEHRTIVFYESPHKLLKTLKEFKTYFGEDRLISASRELTKLYEETVRGTADELIKHFSQKAPKGEFVLVLSPAEVISPVSKKDKYKDKK